jgi:hypothetical protein
MDLTNYLFKTQDKFRKRNFWFTRDRLFYRILIPILKFITLCLFIVIKDKKQLTRYTLVRLYITYYQKNLLLTKGIVVWGHIVQANSLLFQRGKKNHSAAIVYSLEPIFNRNLSQLSRIAWELYELKDRRIEHPEVIDLKAIATAITNETDCLFNIRIPQSITLDRVVYYTTIAVYRQDLPTKCLQNNWFPLLIAPGITENAMILPAKYWHNNLVRAWVNNL